MPRADDLTTLAYDSTVDPIDAAAASFLDQQFGPGAWAYDPSGDCWVAPDLSYQGPGRRFRVFRRDGYAFLSTVLPGELH
jgi:hypothetical protein